MVLRISKTFASFTTFVPFSLLNDTTMSYFFHNYILLLLFDILCTAPRRLLIKVTTVAVQSIILYRPPGPTHSCRTRRSYRIKWEALSNKDVRKTFADSVSCLSRELAEYRAEVELQLFKATVLHLLLGYANGKDSVCRIMAKS